MVVVIFFSPQASGFWNFDYFFVILCCEVFFCMCCVLKFNHGFDKQGLDVTKVDVFPNSQEKISPFDST